MHKLFQFSTTLLVLTIASVWDIRFRRIPNAVTLPAIIVGGLMTVVWYNNTILVTLIALVVLFFLGSIHLMGQGDIKLIMAITAICGVSVALISTGLAAIFIIIVQLVLHFNETVSDMKISLQALLKNNLKKIDQDGRSVPFAPYILAGYFCIMCYRLFY